MGIKFRSIVIGIATCVYSFATYADTAQPGIHLDQSKDILLEQFSSNTFALQVLQAKNTFNNYDLILGGSLQIDGQHWYGDKIETTPVSDYKHGSGLYLTQATLDFMGNASHWVTTFLSIADGHVGQPSPNGNDVFLNRAFFILGNLDKFPLYTSIGVNTLPFGVFSGSGVWDTPLTGAYFNPAQGPQVSIFYYEDGLNIGMTKFSDQANHQNHNVFSVYYNKQIGNFNYNLGAGYLTDLQSNATGTVDTHRAHSSSIPAGLNLGDITDVNAGIGYGPLSLSGEYDKGSHIVGTNTDRPQAAGITLSYTPNIAGRDTTFGIARSWSFHLKNVPVSLAGMDGLPLSSDGLKSAWAVSASRPFFRKNISLGVDFEKSETYLSHTNYTGTAELFLYL